MVRIVVVAFHRGDPVLALVSSPHGASGERVDVRVQIEIEFELRPMIHLGSQRNDHLSSGQVGSQRFQMLELGQKVEVDALRKRGGLHDAQANQTERTWRTHQSTIERVIESAEEQIQ